MRGIMGGRTANSGWRVKTVMKFVKQCKQLTTCCSESLKDFGQCECPKELPFPARTFFFAVRHYTDIWKLCNVFHVDYSNNHGKML